MDFSVLNLGIHMFLFLQWWPHCLMMLNISLFCCVTGPFFTILNYDFSRIGGLFWTENVKESLYHTICMYSCKLVIKKPQGKYILSIEKLVFMWLECFFKFLSQRETHVSYFVYLLIWYVPASLQFQNTFTISIKIDFYRIVNSLSSCDIVSTLFSCFLFQGPQKLP